MNAILFSLRCLHNNNLFKERRAASRTAYVEFMCLCLFTIYATLVGGFPGSCAAIAFETASFAHISDMHARTE